MDGIVIGRIVYSPICDILRKFEGSSIINLSSCWKQAFLGYASDEALDATFYIAEILAEI